MIQNLLKLGFRANLEIGKLSSPAAILFEMLGIILTQNLINTQNQKTHAQENGAFVKLSMWFPWMASKQIKTRADNPNTICKIN